MDAPVCEKGRDKVGPARGGEIGELIVINEEWRADTVEC